MAEITELMPLLLPSFLFGSAFKPQTEQQAWVLCIQTAGGNKAVASGIKHCVHMRACVRASASADGVSRHVWEGTRILKNRLRKVACLRSKY